MEVPPDYVFSMMQNVMNDKFEELNGKVDELKGDIHETRIELKEDIKTIRFNCASTTKDMDNRLRVLEESRWKLYAFSGAIAAVSGFIWTSISKFMKLD